MNYSLRKGPALGLPKFVHFTIAQMQLILVVLSYGIIFLTLQGPAIHYLRLKIKLNILEILIADV